MAAWCWATGAQGADLVLGMSAAFSGPAEGLGIELYRGVQAYLSHLNDQGGLAGRRVVLKAYDDGYQPELAINNTIRLVESDDAFLLLSYLGTPTVSRVLPLLKRYSEHQILLFFPLTGAQALREFPYDQFVFNLRASYRQEAQGLVEHLLRAGLKRLGVFYQADAYGRSGWDGVRQSLAGQGLRLAGDAAYNRGEDFQADMRPQVEILRASGAEAVVCVGTYAACAAFVRDARLLGWQVPIANLSFVHSDAFLALLAKAGQNAAGDLTRDLIISQVVPSYEDLSLPAAVQYRALMDRYQPAPPAGLGPSDYRPFRYSMVGFEGFLNAKLLARVLALLPPGGGRRLLAKAAASLKEYDLGIGVPVSFGPDRRQALDRVYFTTVEDMRLVPIRDWSRWAR